MCGWSWGCASAGSGERMRCSFILGQFLGKKGQQWGMNLAGWYFSDHVGVSAFILVGSSIRLA